MNKHIAGAIEYIEQNLTAAISVADMAKFSGYSEYHFMRLFKAETGFTPADYARKRRLSEIARQIDGGKRNISNIAFAYGFNSKENFTRAFKAEHHISPTEYKTAKNSLKLYNKAPLPQIAIAPEIITLPDFSLTVYPCNEDYPTNFWNKYNCRRYSQKLSGGSVAVDFGVCRQNKKANRLDYWIGIRTEEARGDTAGTVTINIPGGLYVIVATPPSDRFNFVNVIHKTWEYMITEWLPNSGYRRTGGYEFESYAEESRTYSENIYFPIEKM